MLYGSGYIVRWEKMTADFRLCHLLWFFPTLRSIVLSFTSLSSRGHRIRPISSETGQILEKTGLIWTLVSCLQNHGCDLDEPLCLASMDLTDRSSSNTLAETERPTDQVTFYRTTLVTPAVLTFGVRNVGEQSMSLRTNM